MIRRALATQIMQLLSAWIVRLLIFMMCFSPENTALAQKSNHRKIEVESHSAADLSLSLLRDNYDIWAEEMMKRHAADLSQRLSDQDNLLDELKRSERTIQLELKKRLRDLAFSEVLDESALGAALFIASRSAERERTDALQRALIIAQKIFPATEQELEVTAMYTADLIASGYLAESVRLSARLLSLSEQVQLPTSTLACVAKVVVADVYFQQRDFSKSASLYKSARECFSARPSSNISTSLHLDLRSAWAAFRLTRYEEVLSHLEAMARDPSSGKFLSKDAVVADLSVMLGVSLSEVERSTPSSVWLQLSAQFPWVASGIARSIKYLSQKGNNDGALRWAESVETYLIGTQLAEQFYVAAAVAASNLGLLEREIDFKERGVLALQVNGLYARSVSRELRKDQDRAKLLIAWAKEVISFRAAASPLKMSPPRALQFFRVVEALTRESIDLCDSLDTLQLAHRTLAAGQYVVYSEKIFSRLQDCRLTKSVMEETRAVRLEMFQLVWKANPRDETSWRRLVDEAVDALAFSPAHPEMRRIAFDALNDALEFGFFVDGELLLARLYASHLSQSEGGHFERVSFISAVVRLLSLQPEQPSIEKIAWLIHGDVALALGVADPSRRFLEGALVAFVLVRSAALKQDGQLLAAGERLKEGGRKIGSESEFGRDLVFFSARTFCTAGLQEKCIETSKTIIESKAHADHDKFYAHRWIGIGYAAQGRFVSAAHAWLKSAELARALGWFELLTLSATELARSGNIFTELRLWPQALRVKNLLLDVSVGDKQFVKAYSSILDWSVAALHVEAFDVAESLSDGMITLSENRKKELASIGSTLVTFAGLIEEYSRVRSRKLSASKIESRLFGFLSSRKSRFTQTSVKDVLPLGSVAVAQSIFKFWRGELEREAEELTVGGSLVVLKGQSLRLGRLFGSLMKGCSVLERQPHLSGIGQKECSRTLSARFVEHNARIMSGLASAGLSSSEFKTIHLMLQTQADGFRRSSFQSSHVAASPSEPDFAILESRAVFAQQEVSR